MIKSINGWAFSSQRPLQEAFALAKNAGFKGFEIVIADEGCDVREAVTLGSSEADCHRWREAAEKGGLQIVSVAAAFGWTQPMTSDDEAVRYAGIEANKKALQIAAWLGTDALLCVPGGVGVDFLPDFPRVAYLPAFERVRTALQELKPVAEAVGVTLALENVWNKLLLSPLETRDLIDNFGSERIGAYFDCGNVLPTGYPEDWIEILGPRIARVHVKDFQRKIGTVDGFCPLLEGDIDFAAVMRALRGIGYDGPMTAEYFTEADILPSSRALDQILEL